MKCGCIIVAAGRGIRLQANTPKAFVALNSKPLFSYSLATFLAHSKIQDVVLVVPKKQVSEIAGDGFKIVAGGETRQDSVQAGLDALDENCDWVFVHDAARPFVSKELLDRLIEKAAAGQNCIAAIPVTDTLKLATDQKITTTINRENLWAAQTPQVFSLSVLKEAFAKAGQKNFIGTDEASLVEQLGIPIDIVLGDPLNIKITNASDLALASTILERKPCE